MPLSPVHYALLSAAAVIATVAGMTAALCPDPAVAGASAVVAVTGVVVLAAGVLLASIERERRRPEPPPEVVDDGGAVYRGTATVPYPPLPIRDDADAVHTPLDADLDTRWLHIIGPYRPWGDSVIRREARIRGQAIGQDGGDDE